jgi:glycosyltransferase involved in cell wall biosynthesis
VRVAVVHNLPPGGARRCLSSQLPYLTGDLIEVCLESATPVTSSPVVVPLRRTAPRVSRLVRPPMRYVDLAALERAWRRAAAEVRARDVDVVFLNPCRFLQAPPVLLEGVPPALYFCQEPRRVDTEPEAKASRNPWTRPIYARLYARERMLDRTTVSTASMLATNSHYTASEIERVYGREATVVTMGVAESLLSLHPSDSERTFLLSVGALTQGKGHDLVLRTAAMVTARPPVVIVTPREVPDEEARLRSLAQSLGVQLDIRIGVADAELVALYSGALATLYLSRLEPFGLVSLEAQASGCPVIVADEGGLPETVVDGITGWKAPRDPEAVAALVDRLANQSLRERMSAAAVGHSRRWRWQISAAQVDTLLAEAYAKGRV